MTVAELQKILGEIVAEEEYASDFEVFIRVENREVPLRAVQLYLTRDRVTLAAQI